MVKQPNIVITGTPGTGKTTLATLLIEALNTKYPGQWKHFNISEYVKNEGFHNGFDEEWQTYDVDEDRLLDALEIVQKDGGRILDWHTCDSFPERWVDLVIVLRCDHSILWKRLEKRGYQLNKIQENNEAEIMEVCLEDARESYAQEIIIELPSETNEQMEENVSRVVAWVEAYLANNTE